MAEERTPPPRPQPPVKEPGLISFLVWHLPWKLLGLFFFSLFLSIVLEFVGITFFWSDAGWHHSQEVLLTELAWFRDDFRQGLSVVSGMSPGGLTSSVIGTLHEWLMVKSGFEAWVDAGAGESAGLMNRAGSSLWRLLQDYILAAIHVTLVCVLRVLVLLYTLPSFFLVMLAGATEGWMMRELRRFGAAYESSFIYHHARRMIKPLFLLPWLVYLNIPVAVWPPVILLPSGLLLASAVMATVATFKKYL
ncbi:TIGR03747 family integrating conjugative element membrane protein [Klebsiella variicola]|uniref:TIGR03747 family integrating conjugative element membrane protein n=1 Tax=Klebsiella variicola TaxID=244366 RepID=UPI001C96E24D|nr:TIGR03747 family integrating conjugative element membrane protein [Klebsiella variicola]MBY5172969.1 TIGR03747 family integrating conjugative element membrane protein [Klebsiella variicola]